MEDQGRSQKWLAQQVGVHPDTVGNWCRWISVPDDADMRRTVARTLGVGLSELEWDRASLSAAGAAA